MPMDPRRAGILREMGLAPLWCLRGGKEEASPLARPVAADEAPTSMPHGPEPAVSMPPPPLRQTPPPRPSPLAIVAAPVPVSAEVAGMDWGSLQQAVVDCKACNLCQKRRQSVFGVGDRQADWLFVGEGPGADEDEQGEPFVGQAGKLLDAMLAAIHLRRGEDVYIANTVKCRPPGNRTPEGEEITACFPFLARQIELLRPRLIVALGRPAAQTLLNADVKIADARGRVHDYRGIPVIVTYHPAYLLRNLADKSKSWEDLCFARRTMAGLVVKSER